MPYITREDGEHFVIPSYRDVLTVKQKNQLKKEILLLSQSYGEYITLQMKSENRYEVAFSPDNGYLLGESIWHQFKKPLEMIYCEVIPNTTEALLVIVKSGSVYLDGSFQIDSIPEELIIFLTQQNNFEIYTYGDVPISEKPEAGKFSFETTSVKSFTVLDKPVFPNLPLLKMYQLQLVDPVLQAQGIGVFPTKQVVLGIVALGIVWMLYSHFTEEKVVVVKQAPAAPQANPYQGFLDALNSPNPVYEINSFLQEYNELLGLPGWTWSDIKYIHNGVVLAVVSEGGNVHELYDWCKLKECTIDVSTKGYILNKGLGAPRRARPLQIYKLDDIINTLTDRMLSVVPGNPLTLSERVTKGIYQTMTIKISFASASPMLVNLIGKQLNDMPLVLHDITATKDDAGMLNGSITLDALGN